jgi:hypothetical protein
MLLAARSFAAQLTRGPYLQLADATGITVVFRTDLPSVGTVRYGTGALGTSVSDLVPTTEHVLRLSGLTPSTRYGYEIAVDGVTVAGGDAFRFRTHPPPGSSEPFRLFAWGDSGNGSNAQLGIAERMASEVGDATLSLILGDIIYDVGQAELYDDRFFSPYAPLLRRMVIWPTIGNHDVGLDPLGGPYTDAFVLPTNNTVMTELYYSFDYGDAHFVCLDTHVTGHAPGSAQLQWAAADLAASNAKWKFVYFHVPPWTGGTHADNPGVLAGIVPMVEAAGVDVVFSGHSHVYERTYLLKNEAIVQSDPSSYAKLSADAGTLYIVSGTAGQTGALSNPTHPLMAFQAGNVVGSSVIDVAGDTLHGYFLRDDGTAVDLFRLTKGPDTSAPRILAARSLSPTEVELSFDEPVTVSEAENVASYAITPQVNVLSASLRGDRRTVRLQTAAHPRGRYTVRATDVGDGAGNLSSPTVAAPYEVVPSLVLTGGTVRYLVPDGGVPTSWERRSFDDSSWNSGPGPVGYGSSVVMTNVALGDEVTLYTRAHFTPTVALSRLRELTLEIDYDDGFVAYLNGVEISRQNVTAQQTSTTAASASRERGLLEHRLVRAPPLGLLVPGDNVLAIEVHNVASTSSDLVLSARLRAVLDDERDAGMDAGIDGGNDAGVDAGRPDAGSDAGVDAGLVDAGLDAGTDAGLEDAGIDAGVATPDAGTEPEPVTAGCGCQAFDAGSAWALLLAWTLRRRASAPR